MGRISGGSGYGHRARMIDIETWEISWSYDVKPSGCRYLYQRTMSRFTDKAGAERFAKKWGLVSQRDGRAYL